MAETNKKKEKRIKDWLKARGHKNVDEKKADTPKDMLKFICDETGADYEYIKKLTGG